MKLLRCPARLAVLTTPLGSVLAGLSRSRRLAVGQAARP
jgi:hypothetical protein